MPKTLKTTKAPLAGLLWSVSKEISFNSIYIPFSGNGSIARLFKEENKEVVTSDILLTYYHAARAQIENDSVMFDPFESDAIIGPSDSAVQRLEGIVGAYCLPPEFGAWLDKCVANIDKIEYDYKKSLAITVVSKVIDYAFSLDESTRARINEAIWNSVYNYYSVSINDNVFSNGQICMSHENDANKLIGEVDTNALYFYLPSHRGVKHISDRERCSEIFCRKCYEKELDTTLASLVPNGLGAYLETKEEYLDALEAFLNNAREIDFWFIGSNDVSGIQIGDFRKIVDKFKKNIEVISKPIVYTGNVKRTEHLIIARN